MRSNRSFDTDTPTLERMNTHPTRLHVGASLSCAAGLLLYLVAEALASPRYGAIGVLIVFAGACVLCLAELRFLLTHRRGAALYNSHVSEGTSPVSFKLHVGLQILMATFSALVFVLGLWDLPR